MNHPMQQPMAPPPRPEYELGPPPAEAVARPRPPTMVIAVGLWLAAVVLGAAVAMFLPPSNAWLAGRGVPS
jgi:hypothetical protein